jgi:hypothetical protein
MYMSNTMLKGHKTILQDDKTVLQEVLKMILQHGHHSPTLKTILEIEDIIKKKGYFNSKTALHRNLNNRIQYSTLDTTLKYLEYSNKIEFNKDGSLVWIFLDKKNRKLSRTLKDSIPLR